MDEQGAEAAAATGATVTSVAALSPFELIVDKPFLYALRDRYSSMILIAEFVSHAPKAK